MEFVKGMDVSMLPELEKAGAVYYQDGSPKELLSILQENGVNLIRLRLWNDPFDADGSAYGGGANNFTSVKEMARRIRGKGMMFLLDFHYSDFWTDPKKQRKPKAWNSLSQDALCKEVYRYTRTILEELKEEGLTPDMVQIGNELTNGFLWPDGQLPVWQYMEEQQEERNYDSMFSLLEEGIRAARDVDDDMEIILHLDYGGDNGLYREWFDAAEKRKIDYDVIGLSYYPYWHGTLGDLERNLQDISGRYQKGVMVVETSYGYTLEEQEGCSLVFNEESVKQAGYPASPKGQAEFLKDLALCIRRVKGGYGRGLVYWEPAWIPVQGSTWATQAGQKYMEDSAPEGNTWANQALFDYGGNALSSLEALKEI